MSSANRFRLEAAKVLLGTGILTPVRPDRAVRSVMALRRWGPTPAAAYTGSAARFPDRAAIIDERGTLTFEEVHLRTNALAHEMRAAGITEGDAVAIMCRNHRGFIEATLACSKLGASALYLNTAFAGPQITDVMRRENPAGLVYDEDFANLVHDGGEGRKRFVGWSEPGAASGGPHARGSDQERQHRRSHPTGGAGQGRDPHLRHDRQRQRGRHANSPIRRCRWRRCSRRSP